MFFFFKRFKNGMKRVGRWMPLMFLPMLVYLTFMAITPDRFVIKQEVAVSKSMPVSKSTDPVGYISMEEIIVHPDNLFCDVFAMNELLRGLDIDTTVELKGISLRELKILVERTMSFNAPAESRLSIVYDGSSPELGKYLVAFYAQRLVDRTEEGLERRRYETAERHSPMLAQSMKTYTMSKLETVSLSDAGEQVQRAISDNNPDRHAKWKGNISGQSSQPEQTSEVAILVGEITAEPQRVLWRQERLAPSFWLLLCSSFVILVVAGFMEWSDPSLKSERQVARYLGLHVFGSIPNLDEIGQSLNRSRTGRHSD